MTNFAAYLEKIKSLYLIDDDEVVVYLTRNLFKQYDLCDRVEIFSSGQHALAQLDALITLGEELPEVILVDLNMPVMSGWEFLEKLQTLLGHKTVPVFVFSSSINPVDKERSFKYPIVIDYIQKPLTIIKFNKILRLISNEQI